MNAIIQKFLMCILLMLFSCSCATNNIEVQTIKSWEGHYFNANDFIQHTQNISLEKNESIWVLSNDTLNRVLKNVERK